MDTSSSTIRLHPVGDYGAPFTSGSLTPTTPTAPLMVGRGDDSSIHAGSSTASTSTLPPSVNLVPTTTSSRPEKDRSERHPPATSSDNPYRSFRVTLEDPCYKVLPAALKKYKINDDWRQYALFICYGNTGELLILSGECGLTSLRRTMSLLRRETTFALPTTQGKQREPSLHAPTHQGHQIAHRRRLRQALRPSRQTSCERRSRTRSTTRDESRWDVVIEADEAASSACSLCCREGQGEGEGWGGGRGGRCWEVGQSEGGAWILYQYLPVLG